MRRKWLPVLPSQRLMFNRSRAQILMWQPNLQREENRSTRRKTLGSQIEIDKSQPSIPGRRGGDQAGFLTNAPTYVEIFAPFKQVWVLCTIPTICDVFVWLFEMKSNTLLDLLNTGFTVFQNGLFCLGERKKRKIAAGDSFHGHLIWRCFLNQATLLSFWRMKLKTLQFMLVELF